MTGKGPTGPYKIPVGVIEGFFGVPWSWEDRASYAEFLFGLGYGFYIYAPKDDRYLRQRWRESWPEATAEQVAALRAIYRAKNVEFGVGLSPFELHLDDRAGNATELRAKVLQLNEVGPEILCILFDDMRGNSPDLATQQARTVDEICGVSTASNFLVCLLLLRSCNREGFRRYAQELSWRSRPDARSADQHLLDRAESVLASLSRGASGRSRSAFTPTALPMG